MTTVLFTGGGGAGSEALARLLADRYDVHFADADTDARPHGVALDHWHTIPLASDPDFVGALAYLCSGVGVGLLVPGVDEELVRVGMVRDLFACGVLLPPTSFVAAHLDKAASRELLADVVGVPSANPEFPCIIKPRTGRGSRGVAVVRDAYEMIAHVHLSHQPKDAFVVQELVEGDEYTVTVAADATGKLRAIVPIRVALKRGITIRASTHHDSAITEACERIHEAYPIPGCYNVQCIKQADGVVKVFEINPRVSTTLCLAIAAGVDPIGIYLGRHPGEGLLPFQDGLTLSRSWHNEFRAA